MADRVNIAIEAGVADVRLSRPEKINALDPAMFEALTAAAGKIAATRGVRAVVLSGEGRGFCAGIDLSTFGDSGALKDLATRTHGIANRFQAAVWSWRELSVPVIAAVHGIAFGGGFQLTLGADIRIMTPDVKLSVMEGRYGLVPDMAGIALLRGVVRDDVARELTYSARIFEGGEAARLGLATRLANDPHAEALALAREIAAASPRAISAAKRLFNRAFDDASSAADLLLAEAEVQTPLIGGADNREAVAASLAKRPPVFED
jgi:enoyl-CoA hydratase/carnithine racemase